MGRTKEGLMRTKEQVARELKAALAKHQNQVRASGADIVVESPGGEQIMVKTNPGREVMVRSGGLR